MKNLFSKYKQSLPNFSSKKERLPIIGIAVLAFALTITVFSINLVQTKDTNIKSHASAMSNAVEPEEGTLSGNITVTNNASASGGKYIILGNTTAPTPSTQNLIVNFSQSQSPGSLNHIAIGFLHGLNTSLAGTRISPTSLYTDLSPMYLRSNPENILKYYAEDSRLRGGPSNMKFVSTLSGSWGYPKTGGVNPPWITTSDPTSSYENPNYTDWLNYVVSKVNKLKATIPASQRIYDFWNEPNGSEFWGSSWSASEAANVTNYSHFKECYRLTYQLLKVGISDYKGQSFNGGQPLDPNTPFTAPGTADGLNNLTETFTHSFMLYAKNNNVVPDLWNWHFGDPPTVTTFNYHLNYAQSIGVARDSLVLEYLREQDGKRPGRAIYEFAMLESAYHAATGKKIIGAAHARWPTTDELGNSLFFNSTWKRHGNWYAYADYAKMKGARANFVSVGTPGFGSVSSIDSSSNQAWALVGNNVYDQKYSPDDTATIPSAVIRFDGVSSADSSGRVNVTVSRIPYNNFGEVTDADVVKIINNASYTVSGNSVWVNIPWGLAVDGYFVEIGNVKPI